MYKGSYEDLKRLKRMKKENFLYAAIITGSIDQVENVLEVKHDSILGNAPANKLFELVKVEKVCDGAQIGRASCRERV